MLHRRRRLALRRDVGQRAVRVGDGLAETGVQRGHLLGRERRVRPARATRFDVRHDDVLARRIARRVTGRLVRLAARRGTRTVNFGIRDFPHRRCRLGFACRLRPRRRLRRERAW